MFSWIKKHFIPHEGNDHRPHILRSSGIRSIIAILIFLEIFTFLIPTFSKLNITGNMANVLSGVLSALANNERQIQNIAVLKVNTILNKVAEMKAQDMATNGYFAHTSPDGKTPWYWFEKVGYQYQYAGENLAINFTDSKDVVDAWLESPTHKANIEKGNYTEVGTGIATGIYKGKETTFVVQVYANPLLKVIKQNSIIKTALESVPSNSIIKETSNVLGAEVALSDGIYLPVELPKATFWQKLLASPRNTMNIVLFVFFLIIAIALVLCLFIKIKNHQKDLIINGLIVIVILGAIFLANYYYVHSNMHVLENLEYSVENK